MTVNFQGVPRVAEASVLLAFATQKGVSFPGADAPKLSQIVTRFWLWERGPVELQSPIPATDLKS